MPVPPPRFYILYPTTSAMTVFDIAWAVLKIWSLALVLVMVGLAIFVGLTLLWFTLMNLKTVLCGFGLHYPWAGELCNWSTSHYHCSCGGKWMKKRGKWWMTYHRPEPENPVDDEYLPGKNNP